MKQWVRLCSVADAPAEGQVAEANAGDTTVCLARIGGVLSAVDNWCPHRRGPLGAGWLEGNAVVCPWHSWTFDMTTGAAEFPVDERVAVFPVKISGEDVLVQLNSTAAPDASSIST